MEEDKRLHEEPSSLEREKENEGVFEHGMKSGLNKNDIIRPPNNASRSENDDRVKEESNQMKTKDEVCLRGMPTNCTQ